MKKITALTTLIFGLGLIFSGTAASAAEGGTVQDGCHVETKTVVVPAVAEVKETITVPAVLEYEFLQRNYVDETQNNGKGADPKWNTNPNWSPGNGWEPSGKTRVLKEGYTYDRVVTEAVPETTKNVDVLVCVDPDPVFTNPPITNPPVILKPTPTATETEKPVTQETVTPAPTTPAPTTPAETVTAAEATEVAETAPAELAYTGFNWPVAVLGTVLLALGVALARVNRKH